MSPSFYGDTVYVGHRDVTHYSLQFIAYRILYCIRHLFCIKQLVLNVTKCRAPEVQKLYQTDWAQGLVFGFVVLKKNGCAKG